MDKKKLIIIVVVAIVALLAGYKMVLAKPPAEPPKPKVEGEVYVLPKEFLVNLADGRFGKLNVALVFGHHYTSAEAAAELATGGHGAAPEPPEGFGVLPQEALVRDIVTDVLTEATAKELQRRKSREHLKEDVAKQINKKTDVKVHHVLFTDVAVQ